MMRLVLAQAIEAVFYDSRGTVPMDLNRLFADVFLRREVEIAELGSGGEPSAPGGTLTGESEYIGIVEHYPDRPE